MNKYYDFIWEIKHSNENVEVKLDKIREKIIEACDEYLEEVVAK